MAKYYLGTIKGSEYIPIKLNNVGTDIMEVLRYTMSFADEIELKEHLLQEGHIEYFTDQISYVIESGTKEKRSYNVIPMGNNIVTIASKSHFDPKFIREFLKRHKYDQNFYASLLNYYIKKLGIDAGIEKRINGIINYPSQVYDLLKMKKYLSEKSCTILDKLEKATTQRDYAQMQELLNAFQYSIRSNKDDLINMFYYYRKTLKANYTGTVDIIDRAYQVIVRANIEGIESFEVNPDEDKNLYYYIEEIFNHIIYTYDSAKKQYKKDEAGNRKVSKRDLYELGMFIDIYLEYQKQLEASLIVKPQEEEDYDHEEFLEEEDFEKLHTTSEREGYQLRKRDKDLYQ